LNHRGHREHKGKADEFTVFWYYSKLRLLGWNVPEAVIA
jgi:hypothetical protein